MNRLAYIPLLLVMPLLIGCQSGTKVERIDAPIVEQFTFDNIDTCQGVFLWEGSVWLYGERDGEGVIKRLEWVGPNDADKPMLRDAGETYELKLFRNRFSRSNPDEKLPRNVIPHPTGLTHHPDHDAFIGNTNDGQGTVYSLHFLGLTESGSLDDWITNVVEDDLATHGSRPEFIRYNGQWLIATADDRHRSKLRLYDPAKLKSASKTSDEGVLVADFDCGPFVQSMHWIDETQALVLAQSQAAIGDRITLMKFGDGLQAPTVERIIDLSQSIDELTGFAVVAPGWAVMTSASKEKNLTIIRWPIEAQ